MIIIIDNYDSFVFNIARYFRRLGEATEVIRNDVVGVSDFVCLKPRAAVIPLEPALRMRREYLRPSFVNFQATSRFSEFASDIDALGVFLADG